MDYEEFRKLLPKSVRNSHWDKVKNSGWLGEEFISIRRNKRFIFTAQDNRDVYSQNNIIKKWCENNCLGEFRILTMHWIEFQLKADAMLFKLVCL
jgi:hypothetical protein